MHIIAGNHTWMDLLNGLLLLLETCSENAGFSLV
jgi:hypothetical protein